MPVRPTAVLVTALGVATTALVTAAAPASAAPAAKPSLLVSYAVAGSTTIANPNAGAVVTFAPTKIDVALRVDGSFTANLPLAPVESSFKAYGFLPSRGTVVFTQVSPITGSLAVDPDRPLITSTALYVVSLRNVVIGNTRADVGPNCQTVRPVRVAVNSEPGFSVGTGGTLSGTYTLGRFQNCGQAEPLINNTLTGGGNQLKLVFSDGKISPA